jgi:hypothetical protein
MQVENLLWSPKLNNRVHDCIKKLDNASKKRQESD